MQARIKWWNETQIFGRLAREFIPAPQFQINFRHLTAVLFSFMLAARALLPPQCLLCNGSQLSAHKER